MNVHARRFPLFDSLRGIAAILIVARHATDHTAASHPESTLRPFITVMGGSALAIFFVISGFLLYRPFVHAYVTAARRPSLRSYAVGRFLRIAPAYWAALTITTLWLAEPFVFTDDWPLFYGLVYTYFGLALAGIGPAWSLCIEVAFYVFLPFFVILVARLHAGSERARLVVSALAVGGLVVIGLVTRGYFSALFHAGGPPPDIVPVTFLDWLGFGMALAVLTVWLELRRDRLPRVLRPLDRFPSISWAIALAVFLATSLAFDEATPGFGASDRWATHVGYGLFALFLVVPGAIGDGTRGLVRRLLANRALLYMGLVSYGIFLWHIAVLKQLEAWNLQRAEFIHPYLLWPLAALVGATAIASISYYALERPALRLRRRVFRDEARQRPGEALAEPAPAAPLPARDPV